MDTLRYRDKRKPRKIMGIKVQSEIGELRKKFAEIKVKNNEFKDKNTKIPELKRKFAEIESERTKLKAKIAELLKKRTRGVMLKMPSSRSESRSWRKTRQFLQLRMLGVFEITEIKAEIVKLRDNNEENKE
ncbi:hypothetical protein RhiirB3_454621 [Rhizophagus irregularis]|nr:hypothetical protein RhiirB3_454621 [Rhizophagus irregularis]